VVRVADKQTWTLDQPGYYPEWSPSGGKIAYYYASYVWYITVDPLTGQKTGGPVRVTNTPYTGITTPTWSPDETELTFGAWISETDHLIRVNVATGATTDFGFGGFPAWSPTLGG